MTGTDDLHALGPDEAPADRPFAHPDRTRADLGALRVMAAGLRRSLQAALPDRPRPLVLEAGPPGGPGHRVIVCDEGRLRGAAAPSLVGFFAEKRPGLDHGPLTVTDDALILELPAHPGILSYSSLELADGNWGNLILLDGPEAGDHWRTSARHAHAAAELAPRHYSVVRLHRGRLPGGLLAGGDPILTCTRYLDFRGPVPWRAERPVVQGP